MNSVNERYEVIVGLEIHAELCTKTKIFCGCKNAFGAEVNTLCCPVCMGLPGSLPVLNKQVVDYAIKMGCALGCTINRVSKNDRKNYYYPDLPKAYQISQFDVPLCEHGALDILVDGEVKRVGITRIHIEEDAGKLIHDDAFAGSLVDFNRCGVPLIEIVSEPDLRSAEEAKAYMEAITGILLYLGISDAKMQEGSVRADVNVSVRPRGQAEFGTRTEMKNVNSFGAVYRAIQYEAQRQIEVLEAGGTLDRVLDDAKGVNYVLRTKEDAQDYRYFPEPDLLTFVVSEQHVRELADSVPELPVAKTLRYVKEYGLNQDDAQLLASSKPRSEFFDACVRAEQVRQKGRVQLDDRRHCAHFERAAHRGGRHEADAGEADGHDRADRERRHLQHGGQDRAGDDDRRGAQPRRDRARKGPCPGERHRGAAGDRARGAGG